MIVLLKYFKLFFYFAFSASRGQSYSGDIAIDDILFTECGLPQKQKCQPEDFTCTRGSCTKKAYLCDYNDDCGDSSDETNCGMLHLMSFILSNVLHHILN